MDTLIDTEEAAQMLGVTSAQVRSLIRSGSLPARKFGSAWVLERGQVLARFFSDSPPGRPLSAESAWADILAGTARTEDPGRYRNRARTLRFPWSRGDPALIAADRLGGMISGMHAAQEYLEPISGFDVRIGVPMLSDEQDVYLPASAEPGLAEIMLSPDTYGRAVVRLIPDSLWERVAASANRCSQRRTTMGVKLAPPLAVALDLWQLSDGRAHSAAVSLAEWNGCLAGGTDPRGHALSLHA